MAADAGSGVTIRHDLRPGDLGRVVTMHGILYAEEYGFGHGFEAYVAETVAEYGRLARPGLDRLWLAERDGRLVGSIAIVGRDGGAAQLRWFLVDPSARGSGLGGRLIQEALAFLAVLVPLVRSRPALLVAVVAGLTALVLVRIAPGGVAVLGAGLVGCGVGAWATRGEAGEVWS